MRPYKIKIAPGEEETKEFGAGRNYVRLDSSATVNVTIQDKVAGQEYILRPGDDVTLNPFDELIMSHDGTADTLFVLYVGKDTKAGSSNVSGDVNILSITDVPSLAGNNFAGAGRLSNPGTAVVQLFNPAASGKNLIVESVTGQWSLTTGWLYLYSDTVEQTGTPAWYSNKFLGGANGVGTVRSGYAASAGSVIVGYNAKATAYDEVKMLKGRQIIVPPGYGLSVVPGTAGGDVLAQFEWSEALI